MGYDRNAEQLIDEKSRLLSDLAARGGRLFFTHDPTLAIAKVVLSGDRMIAVDGQERVAGMEA